MKYEIAPGQSAFPADRENQTWGLTKREAIAAMALQGLLATYDADIDFPETQDRIAGNAVALADALIERLNQQD